MSRLPIYVLDCVARSDVTKSGILLSSTIFITLEWADHNVLVI